jgi:hypothetical protein
MPFIRGRYHINPIMGQALEAARQAESALAEIEARARQNPADGSADNQGGDAENDSYADDATGFRSAQGAAPGKGPVHRVEIEAAEVVPSHSGRAQRGFVARVHHAAPAPVGSGAGSEHGPNSDDWRNPSPASPPAPETHFFSDHGDLVDFLREVLARDAKR